MVPYSLALPSPSCYIALGGFPCEDMSSLVMECLCVLSFPASLSLLLLLWSFIFQIKHPAIAKLCLSFFFLGTWTKDYCNNLFIDLLASVLYFLASTVFSIKGDLFIYLFF